MFLEVEKEEHSIQNKQNKCKPKTTSQKDSSHFVNILPLPSFL